MVHNIQWDCMKQYLRKLRAGVLLLLFGVNPLSAQDSLNVEQGEMLKMRYEQALDDFCHYIHIIGSKQISQTRKAVAIESALALFYNDGEPYEEDGKQRRGATVMVINKYGRKYAPKRLKDFLDNLKRLTCYKYSLVKAEIPISIPVQQITNVHDNVYCFTGVMKQDFIDSLTNVHDVTVVKRKFYLVKEYVPTPNGVETVFKPFLSGEIVLLKI